MTADVSINLFSGRRNPRWLIRDPLATQFRELVLGLPRASGPANDLPDPLRRPGGGYRGLEITFSDQAGTGTLSVVLFGGLVFQKRPKILRIDNGSPSLAERIYQSAPAGVMTICDGLPLIKLAAGGPPKLITGIQGGAGAVRCDGFPRFLVDADDWLEFQDVNNCYNYANNVLNQEDVPGAAVPGPADNTNITRLSLRKALIKDTLMPLGKSLPDACPENGSDIVCIVLRRHDHGSIRDFHCLRLDANGEWSHKDGNGPVTNLDNSDPGALITDIRTANLVWNPSLVGFYLAASDKSKIK